MNHLGYYGKVRHRGDFVRFNLPGTLVDVWDDWLRGVLTSAEREAEAGWAQTWDAGRAWRFALSRGVAGAQGWFGVTIASSDKVGRRFPFMLAAELPVGMHPAGALHALDDGFARLGTLARAALESVEDFDALQDRLHAIACDADASVPAPMLIETHGPGGDEASHLGVWSDVPHALGHVAGTASMLDATLAQTFGLYSVWSAAAPPEAGSLDGSAPVGTLVVPGLPHGAGGVALFAGQPGASGCASAVRAPASPEDASDSPVEAAADVAVAASAEAEAEAGPRSVDGHGPAIEDELLSTGDWSALESIPDSAPDARSSVGESLARTPLGPPPVPVKEPLELDDDAGEAPWER